MKNLIKTLIVALVFVQIACKTTRYSPADFPDGQIIFGSGGGFSGLLIEYILLENGQLFKKTSADKKIMEGKAISSQQTKQVFNNYSFLKIGNAKHNHPGNLYYFIRYKRKDKGHEVVWGDNTYPMDPQIKVYYQILTKLVQGKEFNSEVIQNK